MSAVGTWLELSLTQLFLRHTTAWTPALRTRSSRSPRSATGSGTR
ncbi:hypothetical protein ACQEU3_19395 [Spirillospora sp. CA-253888]